MKLFLALFLIAAWGGTFIAAQEPAKKEEPAKQVETPKKEEPKPSLSKFEFPRAKKGEKNSKGVLDLTFDDLKFDIEKGAKFDRSALPSKIEDYQGKKINIRGYILPDSTYQREGIKVFILVRDDKECCFGPMAAIYDCMRIELEGEGISFTTRPIGVEGTFEIREWAVINGVPRAIFHVKATSAKP